MMEEIAIEGPSTAPSHTTAERTSISVPRSNNNSDPTPTHETLHDLEAGRQQAREGLRTRATQGLDSSQDHENPQGI